MKSQCRKVVQDYIFIVPVINGHKKSTRKTIMLARHNIEGSERGQLY